MSFTFPSSAVVDVTIELARVFQKRGTTITSESFDASWPSQYSTVVWWASSSNSSMELSRRNALLDELSAW